MISGCFGRRWRMGDVIDLATRRLVKEGDEIAAQSRVVSTR